MADHYQTLNVPRDASSAAIDAAWRQAAARWHHDRWVKAPADEQQLAARKYSAAHEAHEVLSDPVRRAVYDRAPRARRTPTPAAPAAEVAEVKPASSVDRFREVTGSEPTERQRRGLGLLDATFRFRKLFG